MNRFFILVSVLFVGLLCFHALGKVLFNVKMIYLSVVLCNLTLWLWRQREREREREKRPSGIIIKECLHPI